MSNWVDTYGKHKTDVSRPCYFWMVEKDVESYGTLIVFRKQIAEKEENWRKKAEH